MNPLHFLTALAAAVAGWMALMWFALLAVSTPEAKLARVREAAAAPAAATQPAPSPIVGSPVGVRSDPSPTQGAGAVPAPASTLPELEQRYLDCSRAAMARALGFGEAAQCSVIYERLLSERFDGDFDHLLQWSRSTQ
ncbi:MAG: hypothetical protein KIT60_12470 [Burkholderiaceae bacterium]|nr:hypothetical protein [Burkholderiaceae bacterium]